MPDRPATEPVGNPRTPVVGRWFDPDVPAGGAGGSAGVSGVGCGVVGAQAGAGAAGVGGARAAGSEPFPARTRDGRMAIV